jgi:DNA-binding XRE family transcriptional regulator
MPESMSTTEIIESERKPVKMGRKGFQITPEILKQVEKFAGQGLTQEQISHCIGISRDTFFKSKRNSEYFSDAIKRGQSKAISLVSNSLFQNAISGNVVSQIFWLKNRAPDQWADTIQNKFTIESINKLSDTQLLDEIRKDSDISSQVSGVLPMQSQTQSQDQA